MNKRNLCLALALGCIASFNAAAETVTEIMDKVDYVNRKSYSTQIANIKLTTCPYRLNNGRQQCSSKPRVVIIENSKKIKEIEATHARSLAIVVEPISDRGIGMLTFEYETHGQDNDNWLYLPALGKTKRIISSGDDAGSVFGSEFSVENTENPEARKLWEYSYKIAGEEAFDGRPVWRIIMTPTEEKAARTNYSYIVAWIDKERYIALKEDYYKGNKLHKQRTQAGIEQVDGVWIARKVTMNNLSSQRMSRMDKPFIGFNMPIDSELLTQRALNDFAFRERNLKQLRSYFNK